MDIKFLHNTAARDFFLYIFMAITLVTGVVSFINLWFGYIDLLVPDPVNPWYGDNGRFVVRDAMSALIVSFPIYAGLSWHLRKDVIKHPEKRDWAFRKFLVYLMLFAAALTIFIDLIVLINNFLDGELTLHFFLKILVVFVVAAAVFAYYYWDLKRETTTHSKPSALLMTIASVVVLGSIVAGFFIAGSPAEQRARRMDDQRVNHLQTIQSNVVAYYQQYKKMPADYAEIKAYVVASPTDPVTKADYEYKKTGDTSYELCATFEKESLKNTYPEYYPRPVYDYSYAPESWFHTEGNVCFKRTIPVDVINAPPGVKY